MCGKWKPCRTPWDPYLTAGCFWVFEDYTQDHYRDITAMMNAEPGFHGVDTVSTVKVDKGKLKKWKKRVENGEIQDTVLYRSAQGLYSLPVGYSADSLLSS